MTEKPPVICTLSAEGLRGYASGLLLASVHLTKAMERANFVETDEINMLMWVVQGAWQREAAIAEGFADRMNAIAWAPDPAFKPRPPEATAPAEPEEVADPLYWLAGENADEAVADIHSMMDYAEVELLQPAEIRSTAWAGSRWAVRIPIGDGDADIEWFDTQEEAQAFCDDVTAAAQDAIDAAATPQPQPEAPHAPTVEALPSAGTTRAISDLTEAESLDLKRRFEAGIESVSALATAFRIAATSIYSRAKSQKWRRGAGPTAATTLIIPAPHRETQRPANRPGPQPEPIAAIPDAMTTEDKAEARERLCTGAAKGARDIVDWFGCSQDEAQALVDAWRAKGGAA